MKTIETKTEIAAAFDNAKNHQGAFATCRVLQGNQGNQEWAERCTIDGEPAMVYYIFDDSECESEEACDYPFDDKHVSRIEITEKNECGKWD